MKRNKHGLSHYTLHSFDMGQLVPVCNFEVLPGDSVRMATSCLIRVSPLMTPVMHPVVVRLHHWFVPNRVVWKGWEDFITGGPDGTGTAEPFPEIPVSLSSLGKDSLGNHFGIPERNPITGVTAFPFYSYNKIFNENYRDQDLQAEVPLDNQGILRCAWEKDYFTSARPFTQKGPDVSVPILGTAPVRATAAGLTAGPLFDVGPGLGVVAGLQAQQATVAAQFTATAPAGGGPKIAAWEDPRLEVDFSAGTHSVDIRDFRKAFALQRYQEARAQYGSRFTEYLKYLGVRSSDSRLQRPEYLGGGRATISFSEVLKTGEGDTPSEDSPIGELRGHGIAAMRSRRWTRFFEEHGTVLTLASIRPRSMYMDGLHRQWFRRTKEDYWQKELEQIGQQEIYNAELYSDQSGIFGYQDRYAEYRHHPSYVCGEFRNTLLDWHLARGFASPPVLNGPFVECSPSKRIFAEQTQHSIWGMFSHSIQARRLLGHKTIGRIF